jgi:hypothetical protein
MQGAGEVRSQPWRRLALHEFRLFVRFDWDHPSPDPGPVRPGEPMQITPKMEGAFAADTKSAPKPFSSAWTHEATRFALITLQLGLVFAVARLFDIEESSGFNRITPVIFVGFVIHAVLPATYRKPFFLLVFLAALGTVLPFPNSAIVVVIGLGLIGICHLPVRFGLRVMILVAVAVVLALFRAELVASPIDTVPTVVLPLLGALFMFRLVVYMYDLPHMKGAISIWDRLSYFFLIPNVSFLLFPVVDFKTFLRTWYDKPDTEIYQKGVLWIFRGITHLLLYRIVYYYLVPTPSEMNGLLGVAQYMVATYLLYLRISGQFHIIVGILCLFGYNLSETHHLYYLASSFNDYWRRINIYWKDFMMKLFFYPSFMRLRRFGTTTALVASTLIVFAGTWILHSYQWFWLQGSFPLAWPDALFWGILGLLVAANSVYESRRTKRPARRTGGWSLGAASVYSLKVLGMFVLITVLWTMWGSGSIREFVELLQVATSDSVANWSLLFLILAGLVAAGILAQYLIHRGWELTITGNAPSFRRSAAYTLVASLGLLLASVPDLTGRIAPPAAELVANLKSRHLNERDASLLERGYYEGLLVTNEYTSAISGVEARKPRDWTSIRSTDAVRTVDGVLRYELVPAYGADFKDVPLKTNSIGLRDIEYSHEKPEGTIRIALVGASYEMGPGVTREQTFEAVVEERLNRDNALGHPAEILNYSVSGYSVLHYVALMRETRIWDAKPDAVLIALHSSEDSRLTTHLAELVVHETDLDGYPIVRSAFAESGVTPDMSVPMIRTRLEPYVDSIIEWSIQETAALSRARGIAPVAIYVPLSEEADGLDVERHATVTGFARDSGFPILDLHDAFVGVDHSAVQLAPWDTHLSGLGHQLVASKLYEALIGNAHFLSRKPDSTTTHAN